MFVNSNYLYIGSHALLIRPLKQQTFFLVFNMLETYHFVSVKAGFYQSERSRKSAYMSQ